MLLVAVALAAVGCAGAEQRRDRDGLAGHAMASASAVGMVLVPTVDEVMVDGNVMTWADQAFNFFTSGEHAMALPYFEAALASGQMPAMHRAVLYWFKSQSHGALGQESSEVIALERFVLSLESVPPLLLEGLPLKTTRNETWTPQRARTWARARLFARRIERGGGFGTALSQAVPVSSLDEANQVLMQLRCGDGLQGRVELVEQQTLRAAPGQRMRVLDVHRAQCTTGGEQLEIVFDVTDVAP